MKVSTGVPECSSFAPEGFENFASFFRCVFRFGKRESWVCEEPSQQCGARRFVHGQEVFARAGRDQMGDSPNNGGALLTNIKLRQVEAEDLGLAYQVPEATFGDARPAIFQQTIADRKQVVQKLGRTRIGGRGTRLPEGQPQAL
jgi:hypothetical protein